MKIKSYAAAAGMAALAFGIWLTPGTLTGQPLYDRIHVELPYKIVLGEKTLQPGSYTIQQLPDNAGGRVLLFYTENGLKFETSALTIPALDNKTPSDTKLILGHVGDDYYINKIWVQGKDYGYELPIPKSLRERQGEGSESTVTATYQPAANATVATTAENTNPAPVNSTPATTDTTPQPTPPPVTSQTDTSLSASSKTVQTEPQTTEPATPPVRDNSADRAMEDQPPAPVTPAPATMPNTSANWLMMLLSGGALSGAGLMLRKR